jgi:hypothetical protein
MVGAALLALEKKFEDPATAKAMLDHQIDAYLRLPG